MLMSMLNAFVRARALLIVVTCIKTVIQDDFLSSVSGFHTCCECQKTYKSRMALNRHVREECGRILYTCPYCRNIMPMKFNLLNHLKKEHDYFPGNQTNLHTCKKCGNMYVYYSSLTRHMREECGKAPKYQCLYCPKRSKLHCNLLKHMRTKHGFEQG
ncbi:PREDICTED: zinc finger protein 425-like [Atta colombica]|uniref:zinc finger protein 425-like n=1 Tax=Atta colombica TaxID=520822 RepID=UPI00084C1BA9|nr:PREDICTED: zinc finger protein 425-like [Atta colombica]